MPEPETPPALTPFLDHCLVFDTTLRDGEQSPGVSFSLEEKLAIARQLEQLHVDVIEAGFPASSVSEAEAVEAIAATVSSTKIAALARAQLADIDAAFKSVKAHPDPRLHVFLATSENHMTNKLRMSSSQVLEAISESVAYARSLCLDVEFSAEDASRSDIGFLVEAFQTALEAGATTLNVPDTVGFTTPTEFASIVRKLLVNLSAPDPFVLSTHCHDDLGLAAANSLAAIGAGARQVECTINGLGERAGNASLEEIVCALMTRPDIWPVSTRVDLKQLIPTSELVSRLSGFAVPPNKAVVGRNAFAHESGIHAQGVLKNRSTYEIMDPQLLGTTTQFVVGKHSGRAGLLKHLSDLKLEFPQALASQLLEEVKLLSARKGEVSDEDLLVLASALLGVQSPDSFELSSFKAVYPDDNTLPTVHVILTDAAGTSLEGDGQGDGMVAASMAAVNKALGITPRLEAYRVDAASASSEALATVYITAATDTRSVSAWAADTDVTRASCKAWLKAAQRLSESPNDNGIHADL